MSAHLRKPAFSPGGVIIAAELRPALVRYFKRRGGSGTEAEDLAQDVLVRTLGHALRESAAEVKGYVFRAARNRWHDRLRRKLTHGTVVSWDEEANDVPHEQSTPERVLGRQQELNRLIQFLGELDEPVRNVILLVKLEQMKIATVAEMLGVSRSTVNKYLSQGLAYLRAREEAHS